MLVVMERKKKVSWAVLVFLIFLQKFSERQILWNLWSVVFLTFALKLPIQTLRSVVPKLPVCLRSGEKCENFRETSRPLDESETFQV